MAAGPTEAPPRDEVRVGGKSWPAVLGALPGCVEAPALWSIITPEFYAAFWALQLQDIYVPMRR